MAFGLGLAMSTSPDGRGHAMSTSFVAVARATSKVVRVTSSVAQLGLHASLLDVDRGVDCERL